VSGQNTSAEIFELNDARARLRAPEIDPKNFPGVGPYLVAVRAQQNLSLASISERTHIKASYIEAIEQMAIERLPNRAYGVGFVRAYAEALGLEPEPVIERFKAEAGMSGAQKASPAPSSTRQHPKPTAAQPQEPSRLSLVAVLAIFAFMLWCGLTITQPRPTTVPLKLDRVPLQPSESVKAVVDPLPAAVAAEPAAPEAPGGTVEAQIIERVEPVYPPECEASAGVSETVALAFTITPEGAVVSTRVTASSNACFDRAALNALKRWRFSPRTVGGAPRPSFEQQVTLRFDRPS
jgi:cytoskeleton protein RodZ